jgi:hypothetical protein
MQLREEYDRALIERLAELLVAEYRRTTSREPVHDDARPRGDTADRAQGTRQGRPQQWTSHYHTRRS